MFLANRHTFFHNYLSNKPYRRLVNIIVGNFMYTSHAMNFLLYIYSAPNFRDELTKIVTDFKSKFCKKKPTRAYRASVKNKNCDRNMPIKAFQTTNMVQVDNTVNIMSNQEKDKFLGPTEYIDQIEMVGKS